MPLQDAPVRPITIDDGIFVIAVTFREPTFSYAEDKQRSPVEKGREIVETPEWPMRPGNRC